MANPTQRQVTEGKQYQGEDESIVYTVDFAAIGTPTSPTVEVKDGDGEDVKSTVMPTGSPTVATTIVTLPALTALTAGGKYRVEVQVTIDGNTLEHYFPVIGQT